MRKKQLVIATRESPLALWQANWVKTQLHLYHPDLTIELLKMTTVADKMLNIALYKTGGKGLFVKELEEALLDRRAHIAVHSMKDVPMNLPPGLSIPVMCERDDPRDVLVSNKYNSLANLPKDVIIGTSSLRRQSQLLAMQPHLKVTFLRGNVNTRLTKLDRGEYDAIILAAAGLKRLGLADRIRELISPDVMLPQAGQGVLGIECLSDDVETQNWIAPLNHEASHFAVLAERAMCRTLGGGCHVPIGAFAEGINDKELLLRGIVANVNGSTIIRTQLRDQNENAETLGIKAAKDLQAQGAESILKEVLSE